MYKPGDLIVREERSRDYDWVRRCRSVGVEVDEPMEIHSINGDTVTLNVTGMGSWNLNYFYLHSSGKRPSHLPRWL